MSEARQLIILFMLMMNLTFTVTALGAAFSAKARISHYCGPKAG